MEINLLKMCLDTAVVIYAKVINSFANGFLQSMQQMGFDEHLGSAEVCHPSPLKEVRDDI